ncbi:hypothetical protein HK405_008160, partial [Cladochytrium tenue]
MNGPNASPPAASVAGAPAVRDPGCADLSTRTAASSAGSPVAVNEAAAAAWLPVRQLSPASDSGRVIDAFGDSPYVLPADADEKARLHMQ